MLFIIIGNSNNSIKALESNENAHHYKIRFASRAIVLLTNNLISKILCLVLRLCVSLWSCDLIMKIFLVSAFKYFVQFAAVSWVVTWCIFFIIYILFLILGCVGFVLLSCHWIGLCTGGWTIPPWPKTYTKSI